MTARFIRIGLAAAAALVMAAPWGGAGVAQATQEGASCTLAGAANLSPGLSTTSQAFQYAFAGSLSSCASTDSTIASGMVFAGSPAGTITGSGPFPTGSGSCASSTTSGVAVVQWNNGKTTVISYSTTGALAEVALQGSVIASTVVNGITYTTTEFAPGEQSGAELVFSIPTGSGEDCATVPVTNANINGQTAVGSAQ